MLMIIITEMMPQAVSKVFRLIDLPEFTINHES